MKILFIESPYGLYGLNSGAVALFEPLGLETVAASVPDHEVKLLDLRIDRDESSVLRDFVPDVCAFSSHSFATLPSTLETAARFRKKYPRALTVIGGHATLAPEYLNHPCVDAIVLGEGEETFPELIEAWENGSDLSGVADLALPNRGDELFFTPKRSYRGKEISDYRLPRRDLTSDYRHLYFRYDWRPLAAMVTSRGCPHRCDYCSIWKVNRGHFRLRPPEGVVEELESVNEPYVAIVDDNTLADKKRIQELIELIHKRNIRKQLSIYARTDTVAENPKLIRDLAKIGVKRILVGLDGFRNQELADRHKDNSVENNARALEIMKQNDIEALGYFLVRPDYTEKDFDELATYVRELDIFQPIFPMLTPLPGTDLYEKVKDQLTTDDQRLYDYLHMVLRTEIPLKKFYKCYAKLWRTTHRRSLRDMTLMSIRSFFVLLSLYNHHQKKR